MSNLVQSGYEARKSGNEVLELQFFDIWRKQMNLPNDNSLNAELLWEMQLSKLKIKNLAAIEAKEFCYYV